MNTVFLKNMVRDVLDHLPIWNLHRPKTAVQSKDVLSNTDVCLLWSEEGADVVLSAPVLNREEFHGRYKAPGLRRSKDQFVLQLRNGRIWGRDGAVVTDRGEFINDLSREFGTRGDPKLHSIFRKFHISPPRSLGGTIAAVATAGSDVYYHWMLDVVPRILILKELGLDAEIDHYIVNCSGKQFQRETLGMIGLQSDKIMRPATGGEFHVRAERLLAPSLPSELNHVNGRECRLLVKHLGAYTAPESPVGGAQRIYISRNTAGNRLVENEQDVFSLLAAHGFIKIEMEDYSVSEQMRIFSDARVIVGPHGSAFTNIVFCRPGASLVDLLPETNVVSCFFEIAVQMGLRYFGFVDSAVIDGRSRMHDSVHIDVPALATFLAESVFNNRTVHP